MITVTRILTYRTHTVDEMDEILGRSLPDGVKHFNKWSSITAATVPNTYRLRRLLRALWGAR